MTPGRSSREGLKEVASYAASLTRKVLIDYNVKGWAEENKEIIEKDYKDIKWVGEEPGLEQESSDEEIASFIEENDCHLLTGDKRAYAEILKNSWIKAVQISKYGQDDTPKPVYLVKTL